MSDTRDVDTGSPKLLCRIDDGVGTVTFNDPELRNPLGYDLRPVFRRTIDQMANDPEVRCLLLTGAGRAFCAGGNAKAMATMEQPPLEERIRMIRWESEVTAVIHEMPKPVIAALPGAAAGAGFSIALAADLRIAGESGFIAAAFAKLGLPGDFGGSWLLTQLVGPAKAREIFFGSARLDSAQCLELGIFNRVVPDDELQRAALDWARELAAGPPIALRWMKANLNRALVADLRSCIAEEAERQCWGAETEDFRDATRAFADKRTPRFWGR